MKTNHLALIAGLCVCGPALAGDEYTGDAQCPLPTEGPDITLCEAYGLAQFTRSGSTSGLSIGTTSWNVGTERANWQASPDPDHPFITANVYRLLDDRFEQIGQMWCKHSFAALQDEQCFDAAVGPCDSESGIYLGVGCTDTYWPSLNAGKNGLGPRYEINPWTGGWQYSGSNFQTNSLPSNGVSRHLQLEDADLDIPGARYFVEAIYVAADDRCAYNNAAWKEITEMSFSATNGGTWSFDLESDRFTPPYQGWAIFDVWPGATITEVAQELPVIEDVSPDGRAVIAAKATELPDGRYAYEYAILNIDMDRQIDEFVVPLPAGVTVTDVASVHPRHHDEPAAYKSGAVDGHPIDNDPWTISVSPTEIRWQTISQDLGGPVPANPIRWGTLANFRFVADTPPVDGSVVVGLFKTGTPNSLDAETLVPSQGTVSCPEDLNGNGAIDLDDLNVVLATFGSDDPSGDVDGSGFVDLADLNAILTIFGDPC